LPVPENSLVQLARLSLAPTTVGEREVVEYQQLPWLENDIDFHAIDVQAVS
jgi:hypothetical protein